MAGGECPHAIGCPKYFLICENEPHLQAGFQGSEYLFSLQCIRVFRVTLNLQRCQFSGSVLNVGAAESKGFEFELQAAATDRLTLMVSGSYIDAEIVEDFKLPGTDVTPLAFAGDPIPDVPEWMGAATADYRFPAFGDWQGFVRGDIRYMAERPGNILNTYEKEQFTEGNLRFGVTSEDWEVMLYIENVTDERPTRFRDSVGVAGKPIEITLVPRTYGVTLRRFF